MMKRAGLQHAVPALAVYSGAEMTLIIAYCQFVITIMRNRGIFLWK